MPESVVFAASATMTVRAYLFDYGGTLDGEGWHWFDRTLHLYRQAGSDLAEGAIKEAFYTADRELAVEAAAKRYRLRPMLERHMEIQARVLGEPARRIAATFVDGFCAITESGWALARATLSRLRERARLGVVSNFYGNLDTLLEEAGLMPLLDVVVESARVGVEKPDPAIYRIALERLGLAPAEVMMVGDNFERDVRVAHDLGMRSAWLRRGYGAAPESGIADRVIGGLGEL